MDERPACRLTDAVHLSHFEDKTLKVLRSSTYSLLTSQSLGSHRRKTLLAFLICARPISSEKGKGVFFGVLPSMHMAERMLDRMVVGVLGYFE